jgi:hypothetical protein
MQDNELLAQSKPFEDCASQSHSFAVHLPTHHALGVGTWPFTRGAEVIRHSGKTVKSASE